MAANDNTSGGSNQSGAGNAPPSNQPPAQRESQQGRHVPMIPKFVVELGDICNRQIPIDTLRLHGLRGRWDNANYAGSKYQPSLGGIGQMPVIPGIYVAVSVAEKLCVVFDPLSDPQRASLADSIMSVLKNPENFASIPVGFDKLKLIDKAEHKLDDDKLKSLLLEFSRKYYVPKEIRTVNQIDGRIPTEEEIALLPGRELFDPWSNNPDRPKYVDQVASWRERVNAVNAAGMAS